MASTKQKKSSEKKISELAEIIVYSHELIGSKPDASHFGKWGAMINRFIKPESDMLRRYTKDEIIKFIDYLWEYGLAFSPDYLYIPNYLMNVIENRLGAARVVTERLVQQQEKISAEDRIAESKPRGW